MNHPSYALASQSGITLSYTCANDHCSTSISEFFTFPTLDPPQDAAILCHPCYELANIILKQGGEITMPETES